MYKINNFINGQFIFFNIISNKLHNSKSSIMSQHKFLSEIIIIFLSLWNELQLLYYDIGNKCYLFFCAQ